MPTSHFYQIEQIIQLIFLLKPKSILDVGFGFGKYGFLAREYLELQESRTRDFYKWKVIIEGIEASKDYVVPMHNFIYNKVYIGDALQIIPSLEKKYDLVLLIDCLEHLEMVKGKKLLGMLRKISNNILISTPKDIGKQGAIFNNHYERHLSQWSREMLADFPGVYFINNKHSIICLMGKDAKRIVGQFKSLKLKEAIVSFLPTFSNVWFSFKTIIKKSSK